MNYKEISLNTAKNIEKFLDIFNIDYQRKSQYISFACPIHGSDNYSSLSVSLKDESYGRWSCWTQHCEDLFGKSCIGLVRGLLSSSKSEDVELPETIDFIKSVLKNEFTSELTLKSDYDSIQISGYLNGNNDDNNQNLKIPREEVRKRLKIPAKYFVNRGYNPEVLDKYDVGLCTSKTKDMYNRVIVPVYDVQHQFMIGCTSRKTSENGHLPKWKHNQGFSTKNYFYNLWYAKESILENRTAILVESPGSVWKLVEGGIENCLAIFGSNLSKQQQVILEKMGILNLILLFDNDFAGTNASQQIGRSLDKMYNIFVPKIDYGKKSDIGEMTVNEIKNRVLPFCRL